MDNKIYITIPVDRVTFRRHPRVDKLHRLHIVKMFFARLRRDHDFDIVRTLYIRKQLVPPLDNNFLPPDTLFIFTAGLFRPAKFQIAKVFFLVRDYKQLIHNVTSKLLLWFILSLLLRYPP